MACLLLMSQPLHAQTPAVPASQSTPLFLEVFANGRDTGLIIEVQGHEHRMASQTSELAAVGLDVSDLRGGIVELDDIAGLVWRYDPMAQRLFLEFDDHRKAPKLLAPQRPQHLEADSSIGVALNYDLNLRATRTPDRSFGFQGATLGIETWAFVGGARLGLTGLAELPPSGVTDIVWRRFDTALVFDHPARAVSVTIGDSVSSSLSWGRSIRLGGLRITRDFSLRRDLVTQPLLSFGDTAAVPSTVDVLIEGNRVFSARTGPGRFQLENIPTVSGAGIAEVTVRGVDGTLRRLALPFYGAKTLLRDGISDWSVEIGYPRFGFGSDRDTYGDTPVAHAIYRRGMSDRLTLEAQAAATRGFGHIAVGATAVLGGMAEVGLTFGKSRYQGRSGRFHHMALSTELFGRLRLNASHYKASTRYADIASVVDSQFLQTMRGPDRQRDVISLSLPARPGRASFALSHIGIRRDDRKTGFTSFSIAHALTSRGRHSVFNLSATRDWQARDTRITAQMSLRLGKTSLRVARATGPVTHLSLSGGGGRHIGDWGYTIEASRRAGDTRLYGRFSRQNRFGRMELTARHRPQKSSLDLRIQGAFALMDRRLTAGPRITNGFAVVDLGQRDVPVQLQNRTVARTGRSGRVLVTGLQPYSRNTISLALDDLPDGTAAGITSSEVIPARKAGVHVPLSVHREDAHRIVRLQDIQGRPLEVGTSVRIDSRPHDFTVGYDGVLMIGSAVPGSLIAAGHCRAHVPVVSKDALPPVVVCR